MRNSNGKFTSTAKDRRIARFSWGEGFAQGYRYIANRARFGYEPKAPSSYGRFAQAYAYGLQRGKDAAAAAREAGVDLSAIEM